MKKLDVVLMTVWFITALILVVLKINDGLSGWFYNTVVLFNGLSGISYIVKEGVGE